LKFNNFVGLNGAHLNQFTGTVELKNFAQSVTIQGVSYIFSSNTKYGGKLFWLVSVLIMLSLGICLSYLMFMDWQDQQVFTKIQTSAKLLKDIEFPSVTFCNKGNNEIITNATLIKKFYDFLSANYNFSSKLPILTLAELINLAVCSSSTFISTANVFLTDSLLLIWILICLYH
jgi:hypothetical protein